MGKEVVIEQYKKEQAAKKAKERERFLAKTKEVITAMVESAYKNDKLLAKINEILNEEMTYTDNAGVTRTVKGFENDRQNNTYGTKNIFDTNEFRGKPFNEVSRNMHSHFKMFCLTKGMTDDEILSLADENPSPEVLDKMRGLKEEFFQMVTNKDTDKIADMYVDICEYFENNLPIINKCTNPEGVLNAVDYITLTRGSGSYLQQTLNLNEGHRTEEQNELIKKINDRLVKKGKTYTLNDVEKTTMPLEYTATPMDRYVEFMKNDAVVNKPEIDLNFEIDDLKREDFEDDHLYENYVAKNLFAVIDITNKFNENAKRDEKNPLNTFSTVDNGKYVQQVAVADIFDSVLDNAYFSEIDSMAVADELTNKLANNHKHNIWGKEKKNTDEYEHVLNQLKKVQKLEHDYADMKDIPVKDIEDGYKKLIEVTQNYLDLRDPKSTEGKDRYKLMLETMDLAKRASEKYRQVKNSVENVTGLERISYAEIDDTDKNVGRSKSVAMEKSNILEALKEK